MNGSEIRHEMQNKNSSIMDLINFQNITSDISWLPWVNKEQSCMINKK